MLPGFAAVREVAVQRAVCPISLVDLRVRPDQVGAFVDHAGKRVEHALYHRSSVVNADGSLIHFGVSPLTSLTVDKFEAIPPLSEVEEFVAFCDVGKSQMLNVSDISTAFASILPTDEDATERYIRDRFSVDRDGQMPVQELRDEVLPYLASALGELLASAPATREPKLLLDANSADLKQWFDYWDVDRSSEIHLPQLRFAVARELYKALEDSVSVESKEAMVSTFFAEADLLGEGTMPRDVFLELLAPALKANLSLPSPKAVASTQNPKPIGRKPSWEGDASLASTSLTMIRLILESPATGERVNVEVPRNGTVADVRSRVRATWGVAGPLLCLDGRLLAEDAAPLLSVAGLRAGSTIQVLPDASNTSGCLVS